MSRLEDTGPNLFGSIAARPKNNLISQLGDSRLDYGDSITGQAYAGLTYPQSVATWLEGMCGQRVQIPPQYNYAVEGYKLQDVIDNTLTTACNSPAATVLLLAGTNSFNAAVTYTDCVAQMTTILDALYAAGKTVVLLAEAPRDGYSLQSYAESFLRFVHWLRTVAFARPGVVGVNIYPVLAKTLSTDVTDTRNTTYYKDGAHWMGRGGYLVAKTIAPAINALFPPLDLLIGNNFDLYTANNPTGNLIANGMMDGTGGSVGTMNGATGTGSIATNFQLAGDNSTGITATAAKATLEDGSPAQQITLSGAFSSSSTSRAIRLQTTSDFSSYLSAGDVLELMAKLEIDGSPGNYNGLSLELALTTAGGTTTYAALARDSSANLMPTEAWKLPIRVPQMTVPTGVTGAKVVLRFTGPQTDTLAAVYRVGRMSVRKVTALAA